MVRRRKNDGWIISTLLILFLIIALFLFVRNATTVVGTVSLPDIIAQGYYLYLLPEEQERVAEWSRKISITTFNKGCYDDDHLDWNPVFIDYSNMKGAFSIRMSLKDELWRDTDQAIPVTISWAKHKHAQVNRFSDGIVLRIEDRLGTDIVVSSVTFSEQDLISILESLEYYGPLPQPTVNPWHIDCSLQ